MSTEAACVQAFLATSPAQRILSLTPLETLPIARVLRADGTRIPSGIAAHGWTLAYLLGVAAEHGDRWAIMTVEKVLSGEKRARPRPEPETHLANARVRSLALVDKGDLDGAVGSMMSALREHPDKSLPPTAELLLEITGRATIKGGPDAVRKWIEVFV